LTTILALARPAFYPATMIQTAARADARLDDLKPRYLAAYRWMVLARVLEEKLASLYRGGKITGGVFLGRGQEALSAAVGTALRKGDIFAPLIRDMAGRLAFGESPLDAVRTYVGSRLGPMRGRDGNIHRGKPKDGYYAMISHLGVMLSTVAGGLFARRARGETDVVGATCVGDGATSTGSFHEGLNMAAVEKLPLVVIVANNQYAYSTPNTRQYACEDLVQRASSYGVAGYKIDGTDPEACISVVHEAAARARSGGGPQLVVADLLRLVGHGEHDDFQYLSHALKIGPIGRDCMDVAREQLLARGWMSATQIDAARDQAQAEVEEACGIALREPLPNPSEEQWCALQSGHLSEGAEE
jgi:acetoin:2,6-dichlorophenolindophenol oxidoreductase subunit alpha